MTTIGYATLQIIPSLDGVSAAVDKQLGGTLQASGKKGGKALAKGVGEGLKDLESAVADAGKSYEKLRDKASDALGKVRTEEAKLVTLRNSGKQDTAQYIAVEERFNKARRDSGRATREAEDGHKSLLAAQSALAGGSDDLGKKFGGLSNLAGIAGTALGSAGVIAGGAALAGIGALAAGVVVAGNALYDLGAKFDDVFDNLRLKTGSTGPALQELENATKRISTTVPASISDIGDVVAETSRAFKGLNGADFDNLVSHVANLNRLTGENVNVRNLGKAYRLMGVDLKDQVPTLDAFFRASESSGIGVNELVGVVNRGGAQLKQFGLDMASSAALVSSFEEAGVDTSKVIPALTTALKGFAKAGTDPRKGLEDTITQVKALADAGNETGALDLANKVFGAKGGVAFAEVIKTGNLDIQTLNDTLSNTGDTIDQAASDTDDWAETWQTFKNKVEVAVQPLASGAFDAINGQLEGLAAWVTAHQPEIIGFFTGLADAALTGAQIVIKSIGLLAEGFGQIAGGIGNVLGGMTKFQAWVADLRGDHDTANQLRAQADEFFGWGEGLEKFGQEAKNFKLDGIRDEVRAAGERAQEAAKFTTALGDATASLPDGKTITITDNSPETIANLKALGIQVTQTPTGLTVTATTDEAKRILDAFRDQQTGAPIRPPVKPDLGPANDDMKGFLDQWSKAVITPQVLPGNAPGSTSTGGQPNNPLTGPIGGHAGGGLVSGPGSGISDSILARVSNKEFIVNADATRKNLPLLEAINSGKLPGFKDGGFVGNAEDLAASLDGLPYIYGSRDCSKVQSDIYAALTGKPTGPRYFTTESDFAALGFLPGFAPGAYNIGVRRGGGGKLSHMAGTLPNGVNFEAGGSDSTVKYGGDASGAASYPLKFYLPVTGGDPSGGVTGSASPFAGGSAVSAMTGGGSSAPAASSSSGGGGGGSASISLPSAFSGLAGIGLDGLGIKTKVGPDSPERTFDLGGVAASAVGGQISSALDVFGIGDSPPFLQAASKLISGISIGGGSSAAPLSAQGNAANNAAVVDAAANGPNAHGTRAGQAPGVTYNITARDTEDAFVKANRIEREKSAAKLSRF